MPVGLRGGCIIRPKNGNLWANSHLNCKILISTALWEQKAVGHRRAEKVRIIFVCSRLLIFIYKCCKIVVNTRTLTQRIRILCCSVCMWYLLNYSLWIITSFPPLILECTAENHSHHWSTAKHINICHEKMNMHWIHNTNMCIHKQVNK